MADCPSDGFHEVTDGPQRPRAVGRVLAPVMKGLPVLVTAALCFSPYTVGHADAPASRIASLTADFPFRSRFLLPWTLGRFLSPAVLDSRTFQVWVTALALLACFVLLPAFARRLGVRDLSIPFAAVIWAHYGWTIQHFTAYWIQYQQFVIYDLPSIAFYLAAFLLLTSARWQWGVAATFLFSLNRETILLAPLHAAALEWPRSRRRAWWFVALAIAVGASHVALVMAMGAPPGSVAYNMLPWNVRWVWQAPLILLSIGCGAVIWLPFLWWRLSSADRRLLLFSAPFAGALCRAGYITADRMWNEMVPLFAYLLARLCLTFRTMMHGRLNGLTPLAAPIGCSDDDPRHGQDRSSPNARHGVRRAR